MARITALERHDIRFPTSATLAGSDAMNPAPDYSASYLAIRTDAGDRLEGHGFVFTIGRGNDVQVAAIGALEPYLLGRNVEALLDDLGGLWHELVYDSQLRWLGPEKGVMHMAIGAAVNALWDLKAKRAGRPLWQLLAAMDVEQLLDLVDFGYLSNAMTRDQARALLHRAEPGRAAREADLLAQGYPAYTTTPGWLGYDDEKLRRLCRAAGVEGFTQVKLKVGADLSEDLRRMEIAREACGDEMRIAIDANQRWEVDEAITWIGELKRFDLAWVEEPTSPDDVLGNAEIARAVAPVPVASGEHLANRVMAKQFLQAGALDVLQLDATRVAGVNENLAILLLAAHFGVPVCPHAGGVGLCETVQHLAMFDYVAVSGSTKNRVIEYVDHLHEHFVSPVAVRQGRYHAPTAPGAGAQMRPESLTEFAHRG